MSIAEPVTRTATDYVKPFIAGSVRLGIIGQGYVGLPLAEAFGAAGVHVDDPDRIRRPDTTYR